MAPTTRKATKGWGLASPYHELDRGESLCYTTASGIGAVLTLVAVDDRSATVAVGGQTRKIELGHFTDTTAVLPRGEAVSVVKVGGLKVGADATRPLMTGTRYSLSLLNLHKDARLYIGDAGRPLSPVGKHVFPLPGYKWGFADNWLARVPYGWHLGIDLNADRGHPIVAVVDGTVAAIRHYDEHAEEDYWGNNLALLGDDGILYCFMHWDRLAEGVAAGSRLRAGDVIGLLGRSGFETKPFPSHLHLEMMILRHPERFFFAYGLEPDVLSTPNRYLQPEVEGHIVNPYPYLVEWYEGTS